MTKKRIAAKTATWKSIGIVVVFSLSMFFTGDAVVSGWLSATQIASSTVLYILHEWGWDKIEWGKE